MWKSVFIFIVFLGIILLQYFYSIQKIDTPRMKFPLSQELVTSFDMGLHSAVSSFLWIEARTELPFLREGYKQFENKLNLITSLDPKFSTPYAYTVMVLPNARYENRFNDAVKIGKKGTQNAVPLDWKIPFYTAVTYHLYLKNNAEAAKYFDIAGHTPGVPDLIKRFSLNYGIYPTEREKTIKIWETIYENTNDAEMKKRARDYILHFNILDFLQKNVGAYKEKYRVYPNKIEDLVSKNIISRVPEDPFGFTFAMYDGGIVGIQRKQP